MATKKGDKTPPPKTTANEQVGFRLPPDLLARLDATAGKLALDRTSLLKLMIAEKLPEYEERARRARDEGHH